MAIYMVTYDLVGEPRRYQPLFDYLGRFPNCRPLKSVWLIQANLTHIVVRNGAHAHVDHNDKILVTRVLTAHWASYNLPANCVTWLQSPLRRW